MIVAWSTDDGEVAVDGHTKAREISGGSVRSDHLDFANTGGVIEAGLACENPVRRVLQRSIAVVRNRSSIWLCKAVDHQGALGGVVSQDDHVNRRGLVRRVVIVQGQDMSAKVPRHHEIVVRSICCATRDDDLAVALQGHGIRLVLQSDARDQFAIRHAVTIHVLAKGRVQASVGIVLDDRKVDVGPIGGPPRHDDLPIISHDHFLATVVPRTDGCGQHSVGVERRVQAPIGVVPHHRNVVV